MAGFIRPPPDLRAIIDKTAGFIGKMVRSVAAPRLALWPSTPTPPPPAHFPPALRADV